MPLVKRNTRILAFILILKTLFQHLTFYQNFLSICCRLLRVVYQIFSSLISNFLSFFAFFEGKEVKLYEHLLLFPKLLLLFCILDINVKRHIPLRRMLLFSVRKTGQLSGLYFSFFVAEIFCGNNIFPLPGIACHGFRVAKNSFFTFSKKRFKFLRNN